MVANVYIHNKVCTSPVRALTLLLSFSLHISSSHFISFSLSDLELFGLFILLLSYTYTQTRMNIIMWVSAFMYISISLNIVVVVVSSSSTLFHRRKDSTNAHLHTQTYRLNLDFITNTKSSRLIKDSVASSFGIISHNITTWGSDVL